MSSAGTAAVRQGFRIENLSGGGGGGASVWLYDEVGSWGLSAAEFVEGLRTVSGHIDLHVSSPGGDVLDGLAIYAALLRHPGGVTTYVDGIAASCASFIAMAGDRVIMEPTASLMIHDANSVAVGNADVMRQMGDLLNRQSDIIAAIYAGRAGGSVAQWRARMKAETWFSAQEAVSVGLADEVLGGSRVSARGAADLWDLSGMFRYQGREGAPAPDARRPTMDTVSRAAQVGRDYVMSRLERIVRDPAAVADFNEVSSVLQGAMAANLPHYTGSPARHALAWQSVYNIGPSTSRGLLPVLRAALRQRAVSAAAYGMRAALAGLRPVKRTVTDGPEGA